METSPDFEDLLHLFNRHGVMYLLVGGLAFIFHAKPRYTKDMNIWVEGSDSNILAANKALTEFGSPTLLERNNPKQILQIGLPPNRIDLMVDVEYVTFDEAWPRRIESNYGQSSAYWIDIESLYTIKSAIQHPRHQEDARVLAQVINMRKQAEIRSRNT